MKNQIDNAGDFLGGLLATIATAIPKILGAALILLVGYLVAKLLCKAVNTVATKARLDERLHSGHGGSMIEKAVPSPTNLLRKSVFWLVFLFALSMAVGSLGVPLLTGVLAGIYAYLPNVLASLVIFLVAGTLAGASAGFVHKTMGDTATGRIVRTVAPVVIMSLAGFMILDQLMIAPAIVTITYAVLLGSTGLGLALAFGLGGRETAARIVSDAYASTGDVKEQAAQDVQVAKQRTKVKARNLRPRM